MTKKDILKEQEACLDSIRKLQDELAYDLFYGEKNSFEVNKSKMDEVVRLTKRLGELNYIYKELLLKN